MRADASGAPAGGILSRFEALLNAKTEIAGCARIFAAPAYERLLRSEKALRRAIPILILSFLAIAAIARMAALWDQRQDLVDDAKSDMHVAAVLMRAQSLSAKASDLGHRRRLGPPDQRPPLRTHRERPLRRRQRRQRHRHRGDARLRPARRRRPEDADRRHADAPDVRREGRRPGDRLRRRAGLRRRRVAGGWSGNAGLRAERTHLCSRPGATRSR